MQTDIQTQEDRHIYTDIQIYRRRQTDTSRHTYRHRQMDRQTNTKTFRLTCPELQGGYLPLTGQYKVQGDSYSSNKTELRERTKQDNNGGAGNEGGEWGQGCLQLTRGSLV